MIKAFLNRFLLFTAVFFIGMSFAVSPALAENITSTDPEAVKQQIETKGRELLEINKQINETQKALIDIGSQKKTLSSEIKKNDYTIKSLELNIKSSEIKITQLKTEITDLNSKLAETRNEINRKKNAVGTVLRAMEAGEDEPILNKFLKNVSIADSLLDVHNMDRLRVSLAESVNMLRSLSDDLENNMKQTAEVKSDLTDESANLKNRKGIIEDQKQYKQQLLTVSKTKETAFQKQLSDLEKKQIAINDELDGLEEKLRQYFDQSWLAGGITALMRPLPMSAILTQGYGYTSFAKRAYKSGFHNGIDWGTPIGTPVKSAATGIIFAVGNCGQYQYGKYIVVMHPGNIMTLYGHLSKQNVSVGDRVGVGEIIGYSGSTGYSTGPHLHFTAYAEPSECRSNRSSSDKCVHLKYFAGAGLVPVGVTVNPSDFLL